MRISATPISDANKFSYFFFNSKESENYVNNQQVRLIKKHANSMSFVFKSGMARLQIEINSHDQ
jgi:hypothetical protein